MLLPPAYVVWMLIDGDVSDIQRELGRRSNLELLTSTLTLTAIVTAASTVLGVAFAWLVTRTDLPARRLWTVLLVLPLGLPSYLAAFTLWTMLRPHGVLQQQWLRLPPEVRVPLDGLPAAAICLTLICTPLVLLTVRGAILRVPAQQEQAARLLGSSPWQVVQLVLLPQVRPAAVLGALLVALYVMSDFGAVIIWHCDTLTVGVYNRRQEPTAGAALAFVLLALTAAVVFAAGRVRGREVMGVFEPPPRQPLGHWRWPVLAGLSGIVLLGLGTPICALGVWLRGGLRSSQGLEPSWSAIGHSVEAAFLAAAVCALLCVPLVLGAARFPGRATRLTEGALYSGHALPGVVIGLALTFFALRMTPVRFGLYQSLPVLIVAYVVRFLPLAYGTLLASWQKVSVREEEAARTLGHGALQTFWRVTLPLIAPGLLAAIALVWVETLKELPATLMLSPNGFDTLAFKVFDAADDAQFGRAALPALILLVISTCGVALLLRAEGHLERR